MNYLLIFTAAFCLLIIALRYLSAASRPKHQRPHSTWSRRARLARLLIGAAAALYAIAHNLTSLGQKIGP